MKAYAFALAFALFGGHSLGAYADEHLRDTWIEKGDRILSREYGLNLSFLSERFNVFCKGSRSQPKIGIVVRPAAELCAVEDSTGIAHISLYVENFSFYESDVLRPDPLQPLSFTYTASHPWKEKMAEQFLSHTTRAVTTSLTPAKGSSAFLVHQIEKESRCEGVPHSKVYTLLTEGVTRSEDRAEKHIRHETSVVLGFFTHLTEYEFVNEMGALGEPVLRELYFTVAVYNSPNVSKDITLEGCTIIKNIASQARRN